MRALSGIDTEVSMLSRVSRKRSVRSNLYCITKFAIHNTYHTSLRSSSLFEPRYSSLKNFKQRNTNLLRKYVGIKSWYKRKRRQEKSRAESHTRGHAQSPPPCSTAPIFVTLHLLGFKCSNFETIFEYKLLVSRFISKYKLLVLGFISRYRLLVLGPILGYRLLVLRTILWYRLSALSFTFGYKLLVLESIFGYKLWL